MWIGLSYIAVGIILAGMLVRFDLADHEDDMFPAVSMFIVVLWPIFIISGLVYKISCFVVNIIVKIGGKK